MVGIVDSTFIALFLWGSFALTLPSIRYHAMVGISLALWMAARCFCVRLTLYTKPGLWPSLYGEGNAVIYHLSLCLIMVML